MIARVFLTFQLIIGLYGISYGQYAIDSIPKELLSRASATIREDEMLVQIKSPSEVLISGKKVISIHNQAGEQHENILFYYDKSKQIREIKGEILDQFGKPIRKFSLKDFNDYSAGSGENMFDDYRVKAFMPNMTTYPFSISYTYEIKSNQSLVLPIWRPDYQKDISIQKSSFRILCSPEETLRIKSKNLPSEVQIGSQEKLKTYSWELQDIKAMRSEPYSPGRDLTAVEVMVVPERFQYFKNKGEFNDWKSFGLWMNQTLLKDKKQLPEATISQVKAMIQGVDSDKEKARILYKFMQNKTRYISIQVGIGGFEPFPASDVDRLGYGDCKALVNYMQALLDIAEIPSYYSVVQAGDYKVDVDPDFANIVDGNHIILCLPFSNDTTWLECTSQDMPFGFLGSFTDDRLVLACSPDGGKILRTTSYTYEHNLQKRTANLSLDAQGKISGDMETQFSGSQFDNHLINFKLAGDKQLENLRKWYPINRINFQEIAYEQQGDEQPVLKEKVKLSIDNYAQVQQKTISLNPNLFNRSAGIPNIRNRKEPLMIMRGYTDIDEISIQLDKDITAIIPATENEFKSPMGSLEYRIKLEGNQLTYYRKLQVKAGQYPAESYEEFADLMNNAMKSDGLIYNFNLIDK